MNFDPVRFSFGLLGALIISLAAYKARTLNKSGAIAAALLGVVTFGLGGGPWAALLIGFFISSSFLSRFMKSRKSSLNEKFSKGSTRDSGQVLANGGVAGLLVLLNLIFPDATWVWVAYAGTLAAVNADTWATELGVLSRNTPRLIHTRAKVDRGTSGGITFGGTLAAGGGSLFIALLAILFWPDSQFDPTNSSKLFLLLLITFSGLTGSLVDSMLGATIQAIYFCPSCRKETERHPLHLCGSPTTHFRGWVWMGNDWVNTFCAITGAVCSVLLLLLLH